LEQWRSNLAAAQSAWEQAVAAFRTADGMRFVSVPEQSNFYVGIAGAQRRPWPVESLRKVAGMPEFAQWLGAARIQAVNACMFAMTPCPPEAPCCFGYEVSVYKTASEPFRSSVCAKDL
ncbi:MAG: hypothetical protein WC881_10320, partial [Elusimicrobiota bacterium]